MEERKQRAMPMLVGMLVGTAKEPKMDPKIYTRRMRVKWSIMQLCGACACGRWMSRPACIALVAVCAATSMIEKQAERSVMWQCLLAQGPRCTPPHTRRRAEGRPQDPFSPPC
jgi:hypothetical protein